MLNKCPPSTDALKAEQAGTPASRASAALRAVREACEARSVASLAPARQLSASPQPTHAGDALEPPSWCLREVRGRVVELYAQPGSASLTAAMALVWEAQLSSEPVVWVSATATCFYPEDAARFGVDLSALAMVRAPQVFSALRSAERLLRSGAFGVVVLDLGANPRVPNALVGKLVKLAQRHGATVLCLTSGRRGGSLGSLVSLRVTTRRARVRGGVFRCEVRSEKDKRRGPGWQASGEYRGPSGLR